MLASSGNNRFDLRALLLILLCAVAMIFVLIGLQGCKTTEYVEVPVTHTEYVYRDRVDSVAVHDSIYIKEYQKGDTIRIVEYRYKDRFRYLYSTDTITVCDTVSVVVEKVVEKTDHSLLRWQKTLIWWGVICTLAFIVYIYIRIKVRLPKKP